MSDVLAKYRCRHGHLVLGCPEDDCPEQSAYLLAQAAQLDRFRAEQAAIARMMLGIDDPESGL